MPSWLASSLLTFAACCRRWLLFQVLGVIGKGLLLGAASLARGRRGSLLGRRTVPPISLLFLLLLMIVWVLEVNVW